MADVHPTATVSGGAELGDGVCIGPYCVVGPHVRVGQGSRLHAHVVLDGHLTLGERCTVFPFASLGTQTQDLKFKGGATRVEIGDETTIREYVTVNSGTEEGEITRVGRRCHVMAYAHVAHACRVGDEVIMANAATLAGHIEVGDGAVLGGLSAFHQFVRVGRLCMVGGMTRVTQDCPPFLLIAGNPAEVPSVNAVGLRRRGFSPAALAALKRAHRLLYREGLSTRQAIERIRAELAAHPESVELADFAAASERGIVK